MSRISQVPKKQGLYDPRHEHDSCGVGFIAHILGTPSHDIIQDGLQILNNLAHRGASGANPTTGDGAGILCQIPDAFLRSVSKDENINLPQVADYACGMLFLPQDSKRVSNAKKIIEKIIEAESLTLLGWRAVPINRDAINDEVAACAPTIWQLFVGRNDVKAGDDFERKLYVVRKRMEHEIDAADDAGGFYCCSLSSRTMVYKGMFLANQLGEYYPDLSHPQFMSAVALVHQRFSTNTFPAWKLAHPYRFIAHNGEINTLRGNLNNMRARAHSMHSPLWKEDFEKLLPIIEEGQSDTASLDNAVELLRLSGYSPAHALSLLIPEAWQQDKLMDEMRRDYYAYHAPMMEPWDGPAEVVFSDGEQIVTVLDRNGLRPGRYCLTDDDRIIMASEAGVLDVEDSRIRHKWFIEPGKMLLVDMREGRVVDDGEIKNTLAKMRPYGEWRTRAQTDIATLPAAPATDEHLICDEALLRAQQNFAYTEEDIKFIIRPMSENAAEPVGAMGDDAPVAVLSARMKPLFSYFRQEFAQVTNPPIDPIREEVVMSLKSYIGARPDLMNPMHQPNRPCIVVDSPILTPEEFAKLQALADEDKNTNAHVDPERIEYHVVRELDATWDASLGAEGMEAALRALQKRALAAVCDEGVDILIISDRTANKERAAIPILLAISAVHHYLVANGERTRSGLVADTGATREVHDFAVLGGYGADAIYPYLAYATAASLQPQSVASPIDAMSGEEKIEHYRRAVGKGILKTMSKMGVSAFQSYCGAQIFEAVGLSESFVDEFFCGTVSQIDGMGLLEAAREAIFWHDIGYGTGVSAPLYQNALDAGGDYAYRIRGESHLWTPASIAALQHAVRSQSLEKYEEYSALINQQSERLMTLRGMLEIADSKKPVPLDEVESAADIVRRFSTGAMSFGSISREAHTTLAIAMNRIGGKSNTGEGGEEPERFIPLANGDSMRSAIKQVASGRFGVSAEYLANSDMMQIKIAQGAKPGEGGQLPGHKVDSAIASVRNSVPGVGLISPPPHHDIYSIEDIAQLIHDLKSANPEGDVSVKLVSRCGVGTVAAGVAKAKSDHITIAGHDGGTGASPLSSIKHAGTPWELGLSETHQTLLINDLRGRIALQVDGQIKTGRDVVIGALLGADEFGFATAPLVAEGCIMMRKCHLNTCPVGIATQDEQLRAKFAGKPEHVVNYFFFVAEEVRQILSRMGFRRLDDIIGRTDLLSQRRSDSWKTAAVDLSPLLVRPEIAEGFAHHHVGKQEHHLDEAVDHRWLPKCMPVITGEQKSVVINDVIRNIDRTAGAILSNAIAKRHGAKGLADDSIHINLRGSAGQSFGAFASCGMTLKLEGEGNDYFGKGLSGGILAVYPSSSLRIDGEDGDYAIVGNTSLYGAISGECYCRGAAGVRFAVRNSGAHAVIERAGDHCCEYMTGGTVIVLGSVGRNFAAGMSGGVAYIYDAQGQFSRMCNKDMVKLESLSTTAELGQHLGKPDVDIVRDMLMRHVHYTNSPKAQSILDDWESARHHFVKVLPLEYHRALMELDANKAA